MFVNAGRAIVAMGAGITILQRFVQVGRNHNLVVQVLLAAEMFRKEQERVTKIVPETVLIVQALLAAELGALGILFQIAAARKNVIQQAFIVIMIQVVPAAAEAGLSGAMLVAGSADVLLPRCAKEEPEPALLVIAILRSKSNA